MSIGDSLRALRAHLVLASFIGLAIMSAYPARAADQRLLLEVVINGYSTGKIGEFVMHDGTLLSERDELANLGLRVPATSSRSQDRLTALSSVPGLKSRLDKAAQVLYLDVPEDQLLPELLKPSGSAKSSGPLESGTGATLNYDLTGSFLAHQQFASASLDLRIFSPWGTASSSAIVYAGASPNVSDQYSAIRLDSSYVYSDYESERRYRLGDFITSGLSWTRPVRLGGAELTHDFSMRPDLVTFPLPSIAGSATVPSTVDVLVNGTQLLSRQVQPGPFQVPQLPVVTGAGTVEMTVTNALGQQVTTTLPFYASPGLLSPDLDTFSFEAGAIRRDWGLVSNDYGEMAGSATYRRGISPNLTLEGHAEGSSGQFMAGGGLVMNAFDLGVLALGAAGSTAHGRTGSEFSFSAQRIDRVFSLGLSTIFSDRNFRDIAAMTGDPAPRRQFTGSIGLSLGRWGSVGIAYAGIDRDAAPAPIRFFAPGTFLPGSLPPGGTVTNSGVVSFYPAQHQRLLTGSYSVQAGSVSFYATGFRDMTGGGDTGILFGITIPLGSRGSATASGGGGSDHYAQVQAQQSVVSIDDWGYQAYATKGHQDHEFAEVEYKSSPALISVGADHLDGQYTFRAEAQGAVSYADGGLFASNTVYDSFAVVDTNGIGNVQVFYENRDAGRTDSAGRLLVPDLRSFDINHISINPLDIPIDASIPFTAREVRPADRSGVVASFPVRTAHGALLLLVTESGAPVPVGSTAKLEATGVVMPVGYDGQLYAEDLVAENRLAVEMPDGRRCTVSFAYRPLSGRIRKIGPLPCRDASP